MTAGPRFVRKNFCLTQKLPTPLLCICSRNTTSENDGVCKSKGLLKRRLFARAPIGALEQCAFRGGHGCRTAIFIRRENRAAGSIAPSRRFAIYASVVSPTEAG